MGFLRFRVLGKRIKAIKFMMRDKSVKWYKKLLVAVGIAYLCIPIALPVTLPLAIPTDIILWCIILWVLKEELDKYWNGGKTVDYSKRFSHGQVIDAGYTIIDEEEKK